MIIHKILIVGSYPVGKTAYAKWKLKAVKRKMEKEIFRRTVGEAYVP